MLLLHAYSSNRSTSCIGRDVVNASCQRIKKKLPRTCKDERRLRCSKARSINFAIVVYAVICTSMLDLH